MGNQVNHTPHLVNIDGMTIELRVDDSLAASALRAFAGRTPLDAEVDGLPVPTHPVWLRTCLRALRWYRQVRPTQIGHRCVFDPSCSRYAELAFRRHGLIRGLMASLRRLRRCKPGAGGRDVP